MRWAAFLLLASCGTVYVPQKVYVQVPVPCKAPTVPAFVNFISGVKPQTVAEEQELAAQIKVTFDELKEQNNQLRQLLALCK